MLLRDISVVDENYEVREHQNIITEGDAIAYIGPELPADYRGESYDGRNKAAMPGFFNAHCHVPMTLIRGYGEGLPLDRWLNERMFPFEALLTADDMYWGALLGIAELLQSGAVSFTDMYMEMDGICRAVEQSGIKANVSHGTSAFSPEAHFTDTNGYKGLAYLMEYQKTAANDRIIGEASIHAEYTCTDTVAREVADFARAHGLRIHTHLSETRKEHEECKARRGGLTPAAWMERLGVFDAPVTAAHCIWVEDADIEILARHGATAVTCPSSNLKLGSGIAPVKKLLDAGVRVAIGTDGAASNNNLNCIEEVNLASILQKGATGDPLFLGPRDTLELACRAGALAQGRTGCGCLKAGNRADLVVYDLDKPHLQPVYDLLSNLLYSAQAGDVALTMVDGRVVYRDGEFPTIDLEQAIWNAGRIRDEKLARLAANC